MKNIYLLFLIVFGFNIPVLAQVEPPLPSPCYSYGPGAKNNMTVTGSTTFTFNSVADFESPQSSNTITVNVKSTLGYRLYIAGVVTAVSASSTNDPIPVNAFSISSTNRGTSPASVTLSESYLEVAYRGTKTSGTTHVLTITRNALNDYKQAPGTHTLTLHIRYCQFL